MIDAFRHRWFAAALTVTAPVAYGQNSSTAPAKPATAVTPTVAAPAPAKPAVAQPAPAKPAVTQPAQALPPKPAATTQPAPATSPKPKAKKKAKKKKKEAEPAEPKDLPPPVETTKIEPSFAYRTVALTPVEQSVYHKEKYGDYADQLYLTLRFTRTYDYVHQVVIEPSFRTNRNNPSAWDPTVVEQAYIESAVSENISFTVGKKNELEGPGFIVNPSDLLNEGREVFDPFYQNEGVIFSRLRYRADDWSLGVGFIPVRGHPSKEGKAWLSSSADILGADVRLQATFQQSEKTTTGFSAQRFFGGSFELHTDDRFQRRQRDPTAEGNEYLKYSAYTGARPDRYDDDDASGFYLVGSRLVFTPRRTFALEAIQNQSGLLPDEFKRMYADFRQDKADDEDKTRDSPTKLLGRHYAFASYQDDETFRRTHLSASYLVNTDDQSTFATLSARYALSPITSIEFQPTFFQGAHDTEFGEMPFSQEYFLIFRGKF